MPCVPLGRFRGDPGASSAPRNSRNPSTQCNRPRKPATLALFYPLLPYKSYFPNNRNPGCRRKNVSPTYARRIAGDNGYSCHSLDSPRKANLMNYNVIPNPAAYLLPYCRSHRKHNRPTPIPREHIRLPRYPPGTFSRSEERRLPV